MLASRTKTPVSRASGSVQIKVVRESPSLEPTLRFVFVILERLFVVVCRAWGWKLQPANLEALAGRVPLEYRLPVGLRAGVPA